LVNFAQILSLVIMYPEQIVVPCRSQLTENGFESLETPGDVENFFNNAKEGVAIVVVNSVCGCAAGTARPGVLKSLTHSKKPAKLGTVFAGVDREATESARAKMVPYPPSSPSIAIFKDGRLVHFVERYMIEGRSADMIAEHLKACYDQFC
jgi:putative YphP/YqiW family bacilliredoxin